AEAAFLGIRLRIASARGDEARARPLIDAGVRRAGLQPAFAVALAVELRLRIDVVLLIAEVIVGELVANGDANARLAVDRAACPEADAFPLAHVEGHAEHELLVAGHGWVLCGRGFDVALGAG